MPFSPVNTDDWLSSLPAGLRNDILDSSATLVEPLRTLSSSIALTTPTDLSSFLPSGSSSLEALLLALQSSSLARKWTSSLTIGRPGIVAEISSLLVWIVADPGLSPSSPQGVSCWRIVQSVQLQATVPALWRTLFNLANPAPSESHAAASSQALGRLKQTPLKQNSGSRMSMATTHSVVDPVLAEELHDRVYVDTPRFFHTYFRKQADAFASSSSMREGKKWVGWPEKAAQGDVVGWFTDTTTELLADHVSERNYFTSADQPLTGSHATRKTDILLYPTTGKGGNPKGNESWPWTFDWSEVLVVGELKQAATEDTKLGIIVQLAGYVRLIFANQHYRRFVHAFTLTGALLRCWIFHRGGALGSTLVDINRNPHQFVDVVVGYATMSKAELGFDTTLDFDRFQMPGCLDTFHFPKNAFFARECIVSRGTTCWSVTKDGDSDAKYVLKDSWRSVKHDSEVFLLAKARKADVKGLVEVVAHTEVMFEGRLDDIRGNVMRGLTLYGRPLKLQSLRLRDVEQPGLPYSEPLPPSRSQSPPKAAASSNPPGTILSGSTLPVNISNPTSEPTSKPTSEKFLSWTRSGSSSKGTSGTQGPRARSSRSSSQGSSPKRKVPSSSKLGDLKRARSSNNPPEFDRVHTRLLMIKGRNLYQFTSLKELLIGLHDAIEGHRSLYKAANILHRDISIHNIMLTSLDNPRADGKQGFLIDLDLAIEVGSEPSGAPHRTGTMEFMAIEVLRGKIHTYRHDLESFFYVFIWICVYKHWYHKKLQTPLRLWSGESMQAASDYKRRNIVRGEDQGYQTVEDCFHVDCAPLKGVADRWRKILFPIIDASEGVVGLGTPGDEEKLYGPILSLLKQGVEGL